MITGIIRVLRESLKLPWSYKVGRRRPYDASLNRNQLLHQLRVVLLLQAVNLLVVFIHLAGVIHGAEFRSAHGAESRRLVSLFGQGFVMHGARGFGIE